MTVANLQTSRKSIASAELASGWERVAATVVDGTLLSLPGIFLIIWWLKSATIEQFIVIGIKVFILYLLLIWVIVAYQITLRAKFQRTVGMYCFGLSLKKTSGEKLNLKEIAFRELLGRSASFYLFGFGLLGAWRHPQRQTWHDRLVDSVVVRSESRSAGLKWALFGAAVFLRVSLVYLLIKLVLASPVLLGLKELWLS